jgi:predicted RNase H-like HicB family nuclease
MVLLAAINTASTTERNTNMYNLNTMEGAIAYDNANSQWFDYCIEGFIDAGGDLNDIDEGTFKDWLQIDNDIELGSIRPDDREEALARAKATFDERVEHARRAAFVKRLEDSPCGLMAHYGENYRYIAVVSEDENGGWWVTFGEGGMPSFRTEHVDSPEEAAKLVQEVAPLNAFEEIDSE